jgi:hypothetical protein
MKITTITSTATRILRLHIPESKDTVDNCWAKLELVLLDRVPPDRRELALAPEEWQALLEKARSESPVAPELLKKFVDQCTSEVINDAQHSTSYEEEVRHLVARWADTMTSEELHACLKDEESA